MIVLDLLCDHEHRFEAWFASAQAFDAQLAAGQVSCPHCASRQIRRLPSAPYVQTTSHSAPTSGEAPRPDIARLMAELRAAASRSEDVGERFPEEARRIHYGEAEERAIKGKAGLKDMQALLEEGITVLPVPPDKDDLH